MSVDVSSQVHSRPPFDTSLCSSIIISSTALIKQHWQLILRNYLMCQVAWGLLTLDSSQKRRGVKIHLSLLGVDFKITQLINLFSKSSPTQQKSDTGHIQNLKAYIGFHFGRRSEISLNEIFIQSGLSSNRSEMSAMLPTPSPDSCVHGIQLMAR